MINWKFLGSNWRDIALEKEDKKKENCIVLLVNCQITARKMSSLP